jgi:hypothetical protein
MRTISCITFFSPNLFHCHSLATSPSQHLNLSSLSLSLYAFLDESQQLATVPTLDGIVWRERRERGDAWPKQIVLKRWCDPSRLSTQGIQLVISGISLHLYLPPRCFPFHCLSLQRLDDVQPSLYTPAWTRPHITPHAPSLSLLTMQREGVVCQNLQGHACEPHRPFPRSHPSMPSAVILSNTCRATGRVDVSLCFRPMPTTTPLQKRSSRTGTQSHRPPLPNRWPSPSLFLTPACRPPSRRPARFKATTFPSLLDFARLLPHLSMSLISLVYIFHE